MTTAEDATQAATSHLGPILRAITGTAASGAGAVGAQVATDPFMGWLSAVFALATAGLTMAYVGTRVVSGFFEIGQKWEAWQQARAQRKAELKMLHDMGLAPTNPDELDTRPGAYRR